MARRGVNVTFKKAPEDRVPDALAGGVAWMVDLARRNLLGPLGERVRIRREGGYSGFDVVLFLLLYFASKPRAGLRAFWEILRRHSRRLAGMAGRTQLPSPASISRALDRAEFDLVRPIGSWLLGPMSGIDAVLRHPSVCTYDARGEAWHIFDYDPTVHALRHRALPEGDDLPEARRRSEGMAAPGYSGRKRGDVIYRRGTLQHAGSGAWLNVHLSPGGSDRGAGLETALEATVQTCERIDHPVNRALMRLDGEFGWVPYYSACRARGVRFVSRLTRPELFDDPRIRRLLAEAVWHYVPDSKSGPRRSAADLGMVTVPPGAETVRADGSPYEPVEVRVVVSRYQREGEASVGRVIDGWQYELFAIDADAESWPAASVVAAFFGRAAQENRFAQEDHEVGLDRIFSYHLPGQELAVLVGLWLWNMRITRGFELEPPPAEQPAQTPYVDELDERTPRVPTSDEVPSACVRSPLRDEEPTADVPVATTSTDEAPAMCHSPTVTAASPCGADAAQNAPSIHAAELGALLDGVEWDRVLAKRPGWSRRAGSTSVFCPNGIPLRLTSVRGRECGLGRVGITFVCREGACRTCPPDKSCLRSAQTKSKHLETSVPTELAARILEGLRHRRAARPVQGRSRDIAAFCPSADAFTIRPITEQPGPHAPATSLFLPAAARHYIDIATRDLMVTVRAPSLPHPEPHPSLLARSEGHRQHRRLTWAQHFQRYALPPDLASHAVLSGGLHLRKWLDQAA